MHLTAFIKMLSTRLYTKLSPGRLMAVINLSTNPTTDTTS